MSRPFDDLQTLLAGLPGPDEAARDAVRAAIGPQAGRLGEVAAWAAAWQGRLPPLVRRPIAALYAAAHAGADEVEGAARARLEALAAGSGAIGRAARDFGAGVEVFDLAVDRPVPDAETRAAMSERECAATVAFGMEALAKGPDLLILGETASGADRAAGALAHALFGGEAGDWAEAPGWTARATARAKAEAGDAPLELLRQLGGRETAALVGAIVAARTQKVAVLLDGYAAAAAAAVLQALRADAVDHCLAASSTSAGHARLLQRLRFKPLLDLGLERSDGLAGVAAIGLVRTACALPEGEAGA
jgi:nicotinate-nucleotide--dimethylbenzimidazole phosphoribosyltransferase